VTPKISEKIAVAQTIGTLSLSLRSIADNAGELEQAIASGEINVPAGTSKADEEKLLRTAMNRPIDSGTTFVTGGDVSRFQRKTMPTNASAQAAPAPQAYAPAPRYAQQRPAAPAGPVVRITRGKQTTAMPIGGEGF